MTKVCYNSFMVKRQKQAKQTKLQKDSRPEQTLVTEDVSVDEVTDIKVLAEQTGKASEANQKEKKVSKRGNQPMPAILRVLMSVMFLAIMSLLLTWFILWRQNLCDAEVTLDFIQGKPEIFAYSSLVIFGILASLAAITWRPVFSVGLFFCAASVLTFIHMQKFTLRNEPLFPEELVLADQAGDMMEFVDQEAMWRLIAGVALVFLGSCLAEYYLRKVLGRNPKKLARWDRYAIVPRVTFTVVSLAFLANIVDPIVTSDNCDWLEGCQVTTWDQVRQYRSNGFVLGFLYNMGSRTVEQPEDYTEARIAEIATKYAQEKAQDTARKAWDETVDNVIIILAETFYDPALLTKYYPHYGGDITPNLHRIFREYPSGYMYSPEYGGSTANVEFEVNTGLSNFWARSVPYVNLVSKLTNLLAAPAWAKEQGFNTQAIHSYSGSLYKRNVVYPKLGFDDFIDVEKMKHQEHEGASGYLNDRSIYQEILDILEDTPGPHMIGAVTMQNHNPYESAQYQELDFPLRNPGDDAYVIESGFQSLHYADQYLGEFLDEIDELDERTVVLWFGDHAAGSLERYANSEDKVDLDLVHLTPYFVYANFEIESPYTVTEVTELNRKQGINLTSYGIRGIDLPTTSPNCLQNIMYDILNLKKPSLLYLVDEVCEKTPILTRAYYRGSEPEETEVLKEYELVNYDMLHGKHYWDGR